MKKMTLMVIRFVLRCFLCLLHLIIFNLYSIFLFYFISARACQPQDVTLHLKAGSYPVISPENITFPKHFLSADQR